MILTVQVIAKTLVTDGAAFRESEAFFQKGKGVVSLPKRKAAIPQVPQPMEIRFDAFVANLKTRQVCKHGVG